jgi:hypothetical protein
LSFKTRLRAINILFLFHLSDRLIRRLKKRIPSPLRFLGTKSPKKPKRAKNIEKYQKERRKERKNSEK